MTATITTTDLAADFDTTPRTLRKFLRSQEMGVGKGSRYAIPATKREIAALRKKFTAWTEAQDEARKARSEAQAPAEDEITTDADAMLDTDLEPTAEDLEMIENED